MFLSSILFGFIVSKLVSAFLLPKDIYFRVSSFQLSLLSGKLILKGVKFATKNTCLRVVETSLTFRYWSKETRHNLLVNDNAPCRLSIEMSGVEYLIYNNSYKYDNIKQVLEKRNKFTMNEVVNIISEVTQQQTQQTQQTQQQQNGSADKGSLSGADHSNSGSNRDKSLSDKDSSQQVKELPLPAVKDFIIPRFFRLFPATDFTIRRGCLMLSNPELPTILVTLFQKGHGVYTIDQAHSPDLDYYRQVTNLDLTDVKLSLIQNKDYNGEEELYVDRPQKEDFVTYAFESFKSVFKDIKFTFINTDQFETSVLPRRRNETKEKGEGLFDYGRHPELLHCGRVEINYYSDVPGPVCQDQLVFKPKRAPKWGVDLNFLLPAHIVYGPWADRNRLLFQKFFLPTDYQIQPIYKPVVGDARQHAAFQFNMNFIKGSIFRVPFRELSKDVNLTAEEIQAKKFGWVDIKMEENSTISSLSPLFAYRESGYTSELTVSLKKCSLITSLTNTVFLQCSDMQLQMDVDYPLLWNQLTEWRLKFKLEDTQIFLLSDILTLFKDLGNDWSAGEPLDITMFIPKNFHFDFTLKNFKLFCNVNEQNIINQPNNLMENAHYVFTGPKLKANLLLPFSSFQSPKTEISFDILIKKLQLKLILPVYNTIHQHLEDIEYYDQDGNVISNSEYLNIGNTNPKGGESNQAVSGSSQFITSDRFELKGKYLYYQKVDPSYLNSVVLEITGFQPTVKLFGFYVKYFLFLKNNFFGYTSHIINLQKYKDNIQKQEEADEIKSSTTTTSNRTEKEDEEPKDIDYNGLEIYVSLKLIDATVFLPIGLYSSKQQATVALHEFLLEIRYLPDYLDLYADFSPLVLNIPITDSEEAKNVDHSIDILNRYIQINDFTFKLHFLYGPKPTEANYADFVNVHIGSVTGNVLVSQITFLGIWLENFFFHLSNKDNALSHKLVSKLNPVYSLLKLTVNTLSLYIYSSDHITEIRLAQGLKMHSNSLIDQLSHNKSVIELPDLSFKLLVPCYKYPSTPSARANYQMQYNRIVNNKKWVEVGELSISTNLSIYEKLPNWKQDSEKQRQFLLTQDQENRLLSFLWENDDDIQHLLKQSMLEQQKLKSRSMNIDDTSTVTSSNLQSSSNTNQQHTSPNHQYGVPILSTSKYLLSPLTNSNNNNNSSGAPTPISVSKTNSFLYPKQLLKWTNSSPMGAYDLFAASTGKMKSSKSNLESFVLDESVDQSYLNTNDMSDSDNDEYQTPESSLKDDGKGGNISDDELDDDQVSNLNERLYMTTRSSFGQSSPLKASASTNNLKGVLKDKQFPEEGDNMRSTQHELSESGGLPNLNSSKSNRNEFINPHIAKLRSYLRTYFFNFSQARMSSFGSTGKKSSFVECSSTNKKNSFNHGMTNSCNPHESIHSLSDEIESSFLTYISNDIQPDQIPVQPKRSKSKKLVFPEPTISQEEVKKEEDEEDIHDCNNTSITTIFLDSMKDIELFATPVIVNILEDLVESFIAKDPSIDYMLDYFQLTSISEQFKVKKYTHNQVKLNLFIHKFNLNWIQSLSTSNGTNNQEMYSTEIEINSITTQLQLCSKQTNKKGNHMNMPTSPSVASDIDIGHKLLPQEEFCKMIAKFEIKSIHGCVRYHDTSIDSSSLKNSIPIEILSKYHTKTFPKQVTIVSITSENLKIEAIMNDTGDQQSATSLTTLKNSGSFKVYLGEITIYCTPTSPGILFRVVNTWIDNITTLVSVFSRYQDLWTRRVQRLIGELLKHKSRALHSRHIDIEKSSREKLMIEFISPEFKEIIGDEAIIHRLGWEDISKMRHYLITYPDRYILDQIIAGVNLDTPHDSFQTWQELINEIYELDQDGELIQIFQSSLIKKVFIQPPGKHQNMESDLQFQFEGISITVVSTDNPKTSNNQLAIGKLSGGAVSSYLYDPSTSTAAGKSAIPKTSVDINFFSHCNQVSLKVSPDLISFVLNAIQVIENSDVDVLKSEELILGYSDPWKEAVKPSGSRDFPSLKERIINNSHTGIIGDSHSISSSSNSNFSQQPPVISGALQKSPSIPSQPTSPKSKHSKIESSPNLTSVANRALLKQEQQQQKQQPIEALPLDPKDIPFIITPPLSSQKQQESEKKEKKKKIYYTNQQKNNVVISVHGHFSFQEIHCRAFSNNNGTMRMVLKNLTFVFNEFGNGNETSKKKTTQEGSRPNGEYIQMIHSCLFSIPTIELHLLDKIESMKPIFGLSIQNLMFNEVLFKTGKKKTRQIATGKREEYIDFDMKYDIFLTVSKVILPFKMSHQFLPKLRGFLNEWKSMANTATSGTLTVPKPAVPVSTVANEKLIDFPPVRLKIDLYDILISTDAISSLPVKYNISRITASVSQFSKLEMEFNICLHQHHLLFTPKSSGSSNGTDATLSSLSKEPINFPRIKAFGKIKNNIDKDKINLLANLEIGFIQNYLTIELIQHFLVLRTTLEKEFDDLLNAYINFAEKKGQQHLQVTNSNNNSNSSLSLNSHESTVSSIFNRVNYNCSLVLKGFEILFINNSASLLFSSGVIDVRVLYKNILSMQSQQPIHWKIGLRGLTLILSDPTLTLDPTDRSHGYQRIQNLKSQIWAGVLTDIALQSYPFSRAAKQHQLVHHKPINISKSKPNLFEKAWVVISNTIVTLQPWAIDKATDLWIYYFQAYQKTVSKLSKIWTTKKKQQYKRALNTIPSTLPIKETNISLHISVVDSTICIPLLLFDEVNTPKTIESCSALAISLGSFSLDGVTLKNLNSKAGNFKVLGECKFSKFSFQFIDNYHPSKLHNIHTLPSINRGVIDSGDCQMTGLFSTYHVQLFIQLKTSGLFLHLDTNLLYYIISFQDLLFLGQEKLKKINEQQLEQQQQQQHQQSNDSTHESIPEYKLEIDFTLRTNIGECRLTKLQMFDDNISIYDNNGSPISSSIDRNQSSSSLGAKFQKDRDNIPDEPFQECFQLPPISISANHIYIPQMVKEKHQTNLTNLRVSDQDEKPSNNKSETNILLILESQEIRLSPFFTNFLNEMIQNSPESSMSKKYGQQATNNTNNNAGSLNDVKSPSGTSGSVKTTPGSTTFSIRICPTKFILNGGQSDQILAVLEIGTMDIFLSSITKYTSNKKVLLMNGTVYLSSLLLKIIHLSHSEERLGLVVRRVAANVGTAHGITQDGPLISILLNADSSNVYFNIKYLDEILLFLMSWIPHNSKKNSLKIHNNNNRNLNEQPIIIMSPPPSPYLKAKQQQQQQQQLLDSSSKKKPQVYINLKLGSFGLDLDILPVSRFNLLIHNICGIYSPIDDEKQNNTPHPLNQKSLKAIPSSMQQNIKVGGFSTTTNNNNSNTNNLYFLSCYTGPISTSCHGKLEGSLDLEGIILCGERIPYKSFNTVDMWTAQISPIRISFDFNHSEILELRGGDIIARFSDLPIENSTSGHRNINFDINFTSLQLQLSCETITSVLEVVKRINETITEKVNIAKLNFKREPVSTATVISTATKPVKDLKLILGQIKVRGSQFRILLFGYSMKDPTWISFNLDSYQLVLDQSRKRNEEIHRQLSILLGQSTISKMAEESASHPQSWAIRDPFTRSSTETKIIKIPVASLIMYSTERNRSIEYYYLTEFTDSIAISVNLNLYGDLREMIQIYIQVLSDNSNPTTPTTTSSPVPLSPVTNIHHSTSHSIQDQHHQSPNDSPLSKSIDSNLNNNSHQQQGLKTRKDIKTGRTFIEKKFQLSPTLNVLGDLTPKISTVFGWLGIKDINYTIPFYTHTGLTDNLEVVLNQFLLFSHELNSQSKNANNNASNSNNNNNN
ncbi:hypothetical protein DLAC_11076 [Tieghemostelium lacteum]|uniref:Csf1 N-terminal domain-containing protein n=1 Tax=Tieghemostelium lacteum TaxID=361077 RepID=A0A151Z352_TIELA|nr:hypothetical protein DLAC_11076 [Tieghemostelium lacteum]|eukprot:KYQ88378.1 hypothetical protein DLAC_11076 [Tieghemostelium lacteum]